MNRTVTRHLHQNDAAIRRCWQEWVNNGRYQGQNGSDRPRTTVERKDRAIVRATVTAPESSLTINNRVAGTHESNMILGT